MIYFSLLKHSYLIGIKQLERINYICQQVNCTNTIVVYCIYCIISDYCGNMRQDVRECPRINAIENSVFILLIPLKCRENVLYINRLCFCAYCTNYMQDIMYKCYNNINICQSICTIDVWLFAYKLVKYVQNVVVFCCCVMYSCICSVYSVGAVYVIQVILIYRFQFGYMQL